MPIALERGSEIGRSGFGRTAGYSPIYQLPEVAGEGRKMSALPAAAAEKEEVLACTSSSSSSSSSSSIGKNSESCGSGGEDLAGENEEVESACKGGPLNALESLEEALPMRRGISNFYNGKSKSFASLSHAMTSSASAKDLSKQANAYTRKRTNLLASKNFYLKSSSNLLKSNGGGISKKPPSTSRTTTLALAVAMSNSSNSSQEEQDQQQHLLPPLHPSGKNSAFGSPPVRSLSPQYCSFPMRSFSLTDLQVVGGSGSSIGLKKEHSRFY